MEKKKIIAVTGIRSEYDILYPILNELNIQGYQVDIVVSGAHLSEHHGMTVNSIIEDGFNIIERIDTIFVTSRLVQRPKSVGILTNSLSQVVERENPDFLLVVGDREESIATAIVGNYMNKLVVHIGGGDSVYGNADDPIRFSVSKLAHLHCCIAKEYAENLINIREERFRVFWTGNPSYSNIANIDNINIDNLSKMINIDLTDKPYVVMIKHPLSSEVSDAYKQMKLSLESLDIFCKKHDFRALIISPNSDPGSEEMLSAASKYLDSNELFLLETLPRNIFINLIRNTRALIGNSSMGILEAPFYKIPVINIGNRQKGRLNAGNVEFVQYDKKNIIKHLEKACLDKKYREEIKNLSNPFGSENAAKNIVDVINNVDLSDDKWLIKTKLC